MIIDKYQVKQWMSSHAPMLRCPVCTRQNFSVDESSLAVTNTLHEKNGHVDYLTGFPLVVLTCQDCAYVLFFSAKQMEII